MCTEDIIGDERPHLVRRGFLQGLQDGIHRIEQDPTAILIKQELAVAGAVPFTDFIIRRENREHALALLNGSRIGAVRELIKFRSVTNTAIFPPSESASGQALDAALRTVEEIEAVLDAGGVDLPRLLHGLDHTAWPLIGTAAARGYDTRIGFEDTLTLPDGTPAPTNAALVTAAHRALA